MMAAGAFAALDAQSIAIDLEPDRVVSVDPTGIGTAVEIDLCIADATAQVNAAFCTTVLARLRPYFAGNAADSGEAYELPGGCTKGNVCGCSCRFVTTKTSSAFVVNDPGMQTTGEVSSDLIEAGIDGGTIVVFTQSPTPSPTP